MDQLTAAECRVLGCLIEKSATVPDTYPMTANALRSGCNQKSSRDPVVDLTEDEVIEAADGLRAKRLSRLVHQQGNRSAKHRHRADEELGLDEPSLAVLSTLLLRGPQTVGELRSRSERIFEFAALDDVAHVLDRLTNRDEPLVRILPRQSGQKDQRWMHLLSGREEPPVRPAPAPAAAMSTAPEGDRITELEGRVSALEARLGRLAAELGLDEAVHEADEQADE